MKCFFVFAPSKFYFGVKRFQKDKGLLSEADIVIKRQQKYIKNEMKRKNRNSKISWKRSRNKQKGCKKREIKYFSMPLSGQPIIIAQTCLHRILYIQFNILFKMKKAQKCKQVRSFLRCCDMFAAPAHLRVDQQPDVSQVCPSIFSMLLIAFFAYLLVSEFTKTLRHESIDSTEVKQTQLNFSLPSASNIRFSIQPGWDAFKEWKKYFQVKLNIKNQSGVVSTIETQRCAWEKWTKYIKIFQNFGMEDNLCNLYPSLTSISGSNELSDQTYIHIEIKRCQPGTVSPENITCSSDTDFTRKLRRMYISGINNIVFMMVDTNINARKDDPIEEYLYVDLKSKFDRKKRIKREFYLGTYVIETDTSLWPISTTEVLTGHYITDIKEYAVDVPMQKELRNQSIYGEVYIYMTNKRKRYIRSIGKVDMIISYAGGLFGIFLGISSFFLASYNEYNYELRVAQSAFNYDEHGHKLRQKDFNFLKYIKFTIYDWVKAFTCYQCNWQEDRQNEETRDTACMVMDVINIFRKIRLMEVALGHLTSRHQQALMNLTKPPSLQEVENKRQCMQYYNEIIRGKFALNIEDINKNTSSLLLYQKLQDKKILAQSLISRLKSSKDKLKQKSTLQAFQPEKEKEKEKEPQDEQIKRTISINIQETNENIHSEEDILESQKNGKRKDIINKFTALSGIENKKIIEAIAQYHDIADEAKAVKLSPEMLKIEEHMAEAYTKLDPALRIKLVDKIPLKIMHRLMDCIDRKKQVQELKQQQPGNQKHLNLNQEDPNSGNQVENQANINRDSGQEKQPEGKSNSI